MKLIRETGTTVNVSEGDIRSSLEGEEFAILVSDEDEATYMQFHDSRDADDQVLQEEYILEYQAGSLSEHYDATDSRITLVMVTDAFVKYLRCDETWMTDFAWKPMSLE